MEAVARWIAENPTLEAAAIVASLATAGYYVLKAIVWLLRLAGSAVMNGLKNTVTARIRRWQDEVSAVSEDIYLLILAIARRFINMAWMALVSVLWFVALSIDGSQILPKLLQNAVSLVLGVMTGASFTMASLFLKDVQQQRAQSRRNRETISAE